MKTSEEKKRSDLIFELLEEERKRRVEIVSKTRKLEPDDVMTFATLTLNREMGELAEEMSVIAKDVGDLRKEIVTKKTLAWGLGILLALVSIVSVLTQLFVA